MQFSQKVLLPLKKAIAFFNANRPTLSSYFPDYTSKATFPSFRQRNLDAHDGVQSRPSSQEQSQGGSVSPGSRNGPIWWLLLSITTTALTVTTLVCANGL